MTDPFCNQLNLLPPNPDVSRKKSYSAPRKKKKNALRLLGNKIDCFLLGVGQFDIIKFQHGTED